ncbi:putative sulfate exporter family transporter [Pseudohoeflea suaedae]|uniref:Putative sulfate exporter family transporter n=1 Tax=Pseudohoeflea suaedae TaxID=877384 RepID=A0A4R5PN54_9HYPH|nr:putative sulfate exporter family transporter [Pseudohoeflea suaedae]TDH38472.1 putative sulfate exporter family transporter [Pseudohoeflea suaedae]
MTAVTPPPGSAAPSPVQSLLRRGSTIAPGLFLAIVVSLAAFGAEILETRVLGDRYLENLVLAILIGALIRSAGRLPRAFEPGIHFAAHSVLEAAIVLLGATISLQALEAAGGALIFGIVAAIILTLLISYGLGLALGLHSKLALLVACGNSICGNSAIAAAAPVINADADDVAASIAFTAVLGVVVVLALPLLSLVVELDAVSFGVLSGMTVYAVPQVLAATQSGGTLAVQTGTIVKLIRVMMLGPVIFLLGLIGPQREGRETTERFRLHTMVPWFIIGFAAMMGLRLSGVVSDEASVQFGSISNVLTVLAMAGLGLGVDVRELAHSGGRVILTATLSIVVLALLAFALIGLLGLA